MINEIRESLLAIISPNDKEDTDLIGTLRKLDEVVQQKGKEMNPRLRHFLENRSYEKALLWIDGGEPEKGVCHK
ncbi:MAG: hypothetical protein CMI24_05910 [Opitutae bacterium]|nr:hypothetical protein [Opitutae bacterium]MEC8420642.1 hypothetical protein [Verrucomicrobiota bacterium]|tara:strand:- start:186 stop:407 length:222 start_codon:yes stop_codon:yes gene_type:complete